MARPTDNPARTLGSGPLAAGGKRPRVEWNRLKFWRVDRCGTTVVST